MLAGLFVAALLYLQGADRLGRDVTRFAQEPPTESAAVRPSPEQPAADRDGPRFQFYELLPKDSISIPESPPAREGVVPPPPPATVPDAQVPEDTRVLLQVGSFRGFAQADEMKARLAMMGLQADVREVRIEGQVFYRVFVGPFPNATQADRWRDRLKRENIEALRVPVSG